MNSTHDSRDLEDIVVDHYPYPIANCYRHLIDSEPGAGAFGCLLDTFETLLHFLLTIVLSAYWQDGTPNAKLNRFLLEKLYKGRWSTGTLLQMLAEVTKFYHARRETLFYPELCDYLYTKSGKNTPSLHALRNLVSIRNKVWGHAGGRDDSFYANILADNRQVLED